MPGLRRSGSIAGDLALLFCAVVWGSTFVVTKRALDGASPVAFIAVRFLLAATILLPLAFRPGPRALWEARSWGAALGAVIAAGYWLQNWALQYVSPSRSAFLTVFYVFFTAAIEWAVLRRPPGRATLAGAVLAFAGVLLLTGAGLGEPLGAGDAATLLCALVFAAQIVLLSEALRRHPSNSILLLEIAVCGLLSIPAALLFDRPLRFEPSMATIGGVVFLATVATALMLALQNFGQKRTTAARAGVMFASEPVWAALFSAALYGEQLTSRELGGSGLVLAGLIVATLFARSET